MPIYLGWPLPAFNHPVYQRLELRKSSAAIPGNRGATTPEPFETGRQLRRSAPWNHEVGANNNAGGSQSTPISQV